MNPVSPKRSVAAFALIDSIVFSNHPLEHSLVRFVARKKRFIREQEQHGSHVSIECSSEMLGMRDLEPVRFHQPHECSSQGALSRAFFTPEHQCDAGTFMWALHEVSEPHDDAIKMLLVHRCEHIE